MKIKYLDKKHYLFGNKGNLWSKTAHIAKSGDSTTLCGTPMLSSNWIAIEEVQEAGCKECIAIYEKNKKLYNREEIEKIAHDAYNSGYSEASGLCCGAMNDSKTSSFDWIKDNL